MLFFCLTGDVSKARVLEIAVRQIECLLLVAQSNITNSSKMAWVAEVDLTSCGNSLFCSFAFICSGTTPDQAALLSWDVCGKGMHFSLKAMHSASLRLIFQSAQLHLEGEKSFGRWLSCFQHASNVECSNSCSSDIAGCAWQRPFLLQDSISSGNKSTESTDFDAILWEAQHPTFQRFLLRKFATMNSHVLQHETDSTICWSRILGSAFRNIPKLRCSKFAQGTS